MQNLGPVFYSAVFTYSFLSLKSLRDIPEFQEHNPEKTSKYSGNVLLTHLGSLIVTEASPHAASEKAMAIR